MGPPATGTAAAFFRPLRGLVRRGRPRLPMACAMGYGLTLLRSCEREAFCHGILYPIVQSPSEQDRTPNVGIGNPLFHSARLKLTGATILVFRAGGTP